MFDAYSVAVKIKLVDHVTSGLVGITAGIRGADNAAQSLHKRLGLVGVALAGTGTAMLMGLKGPIQAAMEFDRQLAKLKQQGLGDFQIADARKFVEANNIMGTSIQQRMKLFVEAQGAFRESGMGGMAALDAAKVMAPILAQYQVAGSMLNGPHKAAVEGSMMSLNKTVEMMGGLGDVNRAGAIAEGVFKAVQSSGKMVDERQLKQFVAYASSAGNQQGLRTIFGGLEPIIGELGGSTTAVGLRTAYTRTNGMMSLPPKLMLHEMQRLHMTDATGHKQNATLAEMQSTDVIAYAQEMMRRYSGAGIKSQIDRERENAIIFGTNGSKVFNKIMSQMSTIQLSLASYDQAHGIAQTVKDNANSPMMAMDRFHKALEDLGLVIGQTVLPVLTPMVQSLTGLVTTMKAYPNAVKDLTVGFVGLAGAMAIGGTLLTVSRGIGAIGGVIGLVGGAGGVLAMGAASPIVLGIAAMGTALAGMKWVLDLLKPENKNEPPKPLPHRGDVGGSPDQEWVPGHGRSGAGGHWQQKMPALDAARNLPPGPEGAGAGHNVPWSRGSSPMRQSALSLETIRPRPQERQAINNTIVMPDGRVLANVVTEVQAKQIDRSGLLGARGNDPRMGIMSPRTAGAR